MRTVVPFWRDNRIVPILVQLFFLVLVILLGGFFYNNLQVGLDKTGMKLGFSFLNQSAGFSIKETSIQYSPADSYGRALLVGFTNTIKVAFWGIILATTLGVFVGIGRLSSNWLVRNVAAIYVEIIRNTPLLVQLYIWYFALFMQLPKIQDSIILPGSIHLSNRGLALPWLASTSGTRIWLAFFLVGIVAGFLIYKKQTEKQLITGIDRYPALWAMGALLLSLLFAWLITMDKPFLLTVPTVDGLRYSGGYRLSPEFATILLGLVVYTGAFIAEIVRAGIQAVSKGQTEAAKALGLGHSLSLRLVILPQALRVIIPSMTSQYLNLAKNSSLAIAVGYPDFFSVSGTTLNQTGRAVEIITLVMVAYLSISLLTSLLMNIFNKRMRLVER